MAQRQFMRVFDFSQSSEFHHPIIFISVVRYPKLAKRTSMRAKLRHLEQIGGPCKQNQHPGSKFQALGSKSKALRSNLRPMGANLRYPKVAKRQSMRCWDLFQSISLSSQFYHPPIFMSSIFQSPYNFHHPIICIDTRK